MTPVSPLKIIKEYKVHSIHFLAEKYDTYPNKIRRIIIKNGGKMKTNSEAQKMHLDNGGIHPTKGRPRTQEEKERISERVHESWADVTDKEKKRRLAKMASALKKEKASSPAILEKAKQKMKETTVKGSKIENFLFEKLKEEDFKVKQHVQLLVKNENMHFDIVVQQNPLIIVEVDGPTHHREIFGKERLENQIETDNRKNSLVLSGRMHIIRVNADYTNVPLWKRNKIFESLKSTILSLKGDKSYRVIYIAKI